MIEYTQQRDNIYWQIPYTLRDRPYIPITSLGQKVEWDIPYHLLETRRRMDSCSLFSWDVDAFVNGVSPSPISKSGTLDVDKLKQLSPYTMPILERLAVLSAHIPSIPNSGKSYMVKQTLYNEIERLKFVYMQREGMGSVNDHGMFFPHPAFVEPITGRMRARHFDGTPSQKLLQFGINIYDNGGAHEDTMNPDGHYHRELFPLKFFDRFTNQEFQALLIQTTRPEKMKQQAEIMKYHILLSDAAIIDRYPEGLPELKTDYDTAYINAGLIAAPVSYASPHAKFNLDLDMDKLKTDSQLQQAWEIFFSHHGVAGSHIRSLADFQQNLTNYFSDDATVSSNHVPGNPNSGIGERMAIDLTPPHVNKGMGLMKAIGYIRTEYTRAYMAYPSLFERDAIAGGDGAHRDKNDFDLIFDERGVTNTPNYDYIRIDGFPSHFLELFSIFGITTTKPLDQIEQTLVFTQLLLHARLGLPKDDLPKETLAKLHFS